MNRRHFMRSCALTFACGFFARRFTVEEEVEPPMPRIIATWHRIDVPAFPQGAGGAYEDAARDWLGEFKDHYHVYEAREVQP